MRPNLSNYSADDVAQLNELAIWSRGVIEVLQQVSE